MPERPRRRTQSEAVEVARGPGVEQQHQGGGAFGQTGAVSVEVVKEGKDSRPRRWHQGNRKVMAEKFRRAGTPFVVIPAETGIQSKNNEIAWAPASAGMADREVPTAVAPTLRQPCRWHLSPLPPLPTVATVALGRRARAARLEPPMPAPARNPVPVTYADYEKWPPDQRWELVDGVAYAMSPAPSTAHQIAVAEIFYQVRQQLEGKRCTPFITPLAVRLPRGREADDHVDTVLQPDVLVVCDPAKIERKGVRGAPDLVVEVLSPASASHDHVRKRRRNEQAGVRELWLLHPNDRMVTIDRLEGDVYGKPDVQALEGATVVAVLDDVRIVWEPLVARLGPQE
jgi:Uma2 family endonuclease